MSMISPSPTTSRMTGLKLAALLSVAELLIISIAYKHGFDFTCREALPTAFCAFAGRIVPRTLGVLAALGLFALARPDAIRTLFSGLPNTVSALALNLAGFALILLPWIGISDNSSSTAITLAALSWSLGGLLCATGLALVLAPLQHWRSFLFGNGLTLLLLLAVGLSLPELSDVVQALWRIDAVTDATFHAVVWLMQAMGYDVFSVLDSKAIGVPEFYVYVGPQCSGVEGFALITVFLGIYAALFRKDLRFPHVFLLFPAGILLSWCFNVLRITVLLVLGIEVSPDLAVGGFHSHAGWLSFTLLSTGMILVMHRVSYFHVAPKQAAAAAQSLPPLREDPVAAQILPFVVFMLSGLLASTFAQDPAVLYPLRAVAMVAALWVFRAHYLSLPWRLDPLALGVGVVTAILWVATSPAAETPASTIGDGGLVFAIWVATRVIGTSLLVPLIEELFFRGYLMERIAPEGKGLRAALAIAVSAAAFALLHDRMLAAALAGIAFGLLVLRSGRLTDAVLAHAAANAGIALWALLHQDWSVI